MIHASCYCYFCYLPDPRLQRREIFASSRRSGVPLSRELLYTQWMLQPEVFGW
jgi:hypothetical protein